MQNWQIILLIFSGLCIFNSIILAVYLQITCNQSTYKNIFIQLILIAFIAQITHALVELFQWNFSLYTSNLYLIGVFIQGPAMYLLIKTSLNPNLKIWVKEFMIHFLPYIVIALIKYDFSNEGLKEWIVIRLGGFQSLTYILLSIKPYLQIRKLYVQGNKSFYFIKKIFPVFAILWITYPISGITQLNYQIIESILHSIFLYFLMYIKIQEPKKTIDKYKFSGIDRAESEDMYQRIVEEIKEKKYYLDSDITLSSLSKKLTISINILSQVINQNANLNLRDFINTFRIDEAKEILIQQTKKGFTIASVAYDCGFNSLSAFNRAFKKNTNQTPSEYIKSKS